MTGGPATDLLEELVHQFSDPFAFYRELIQNSIDSGSTRIEVVVAYQSAKKQGLATATVTDWGEGMNRKVIEDYLLTKFRSSKEHDLTKIGKFGIGFVSVFSCAPDAVVVDTGRDGEFWRVLFKKDKSYELLALDQPVEGTRITLHKRMGVAQYEEFAQKSAESVKRWCRHSEADIAFVAGKADGSAPPEPAAVNEPFVVDAPFQVEHREEGTLIVAGVARKLPATSGLYNRGLTLLETTEPLVPGVAIKIVSRWLEHTLTRDNVRRDKNFEKAIAQAAKLAKGALREKLPEELRRCAADPQGAADWQALFRYAIETIGLENTWIRQPGGGAIAGAKLEKCLKAHKALFISDQSTPLVARLIASGVPVIEGVASSPWIARLVRATTFQLCVADEHWIHAEPSPIPREPAFCAALLAALKLLEARPREVVVTRLFGATGPSPIVLVDEPGRPERKARALSSPFTAGGPKVLVVDPAHPELAPVAALLERAPRLAALLVARRITVAAGALDPARDWALTKWALA
ncbi:MAG: putative heat shock protein [Myxococcaceae bacterium]|nr:putative heat shock protein [Myxococcaceae bacterium]